MNRTIIVTGIPGTGKTTVCNVVEKLAKNAGLEVNVINYGTAMVEILQKHEKEMERDTMRKTDINFQRKLQRETAGAVLERVGRLNGITIIDTHMSIKTLEGYLPGLPSHVLQLLKPEMFVLVEAQPNEISSRRMKDTTRKRDEAVEEAIKEELLFSRLMAGACAVLTGSPVKIVINAEGKQEEAATKILNALGVR
ncbi:MAG: adenylate kinase [Candidatus Bathyarchaeota archaeon]|nr:adenylate kinase [Candidatus Bathyarchaeota archaeon]MDH5747353.1 adenylate kinase [Candidatus Bathyarchaeota archaeon]